MTSLQNILDSLFVGYNENPTYFVDTGYKPLNKAISGSYNKGIKNGCVVEIAGPESSGKTAIANKLMIAAQEQGGVAMFFDYERSFDMRLAEKQGLKIENTFLYSKPSTAEDGIDDALRKVKLIREAGLEKTKPIIIVFDSIPCMIPRSVAENESVENSMKDNLAIPMMLSVALPRCVQCADTYNVLFVFINQLRDNIGVMYGDKSKTPGGKAKDFYFSLRIRTSRELVKDSKTGKKLGQNVNAECIKNKISRPFEKCQWWFKFNDDGTGEFDTVGSTIDYIVDSGLISKSGSWYSFGDIKSQGKEAFIKDIIANNKIDELFALLKDAENDTAA